MVRFYSFFSIFLFLWEVHVLPSGDRRPQIEVSAELPRASSRSKSCGVLGSGPLCCHMHEELPATQKLFLKHDVSAVALFGLQESFGQQISALWH